MVRLSLPDLANESETTTLSDVLLGHGDVTSLLADNRFQEFVRSRFGGIRDAHLREVTDQEDGSTIRALLVPTSLDVSDAERELTSLDSLLRADDSKGLFETLIIDFEFE
jgi:hypothetical protein